MIFKSSVVSFTALALSSAILAQSSTPVPPLSPAQSALVYLEGTYNHLTGELSVSQVQAPGQHVGLSVIENFDNSRTPAGGLQAALLEPQSGLVDWGHVLVEPGTVVNEITIGYGADTESPDLIVELFTRYEGFGGNIQLAPLTTSAAAGGGPGFVEIVLTELPGDMASPGDGAVVPYELQLALIPPLQLGTVFVEAGVQQDETLKRCLGWSYDTVGGGVGPLLVDTQCLPSPNGPTVQGYEATQIEFGAYVGPFVRTR